MLAAKSESASCDSISTDSETDMSPCACCGEDSCPCGFTGDMADSAQSSIACPSPGSIIMLCSEVANGEPSAEALPRNDKTNF